MTISMTIKPKQKKKQIQQNYNSMTIKILTLEKFKSIVMRISIQIWNKSNLISEILLIVTFNHDKFYDNT